MRLDGFAEARNPTTGGTIRIESPGLSVWMAWSGGIAWMDHRGGRIVVKNPDTAILKKMCAIAERLGARVQGDEGEMYRSRWIWLEQQKALMSSAGERGCRGGSDSLGADSRGAG